MADDGINRDAELNLMALAPADDSRDADSQAASRAHAILRVQWQATGGATYQIRDLRKHEDHAAPASERKKTRVPRAPRLPLAAMRACVCGAPSRRTECRGAPQIVRCGEEILVPDMKWVDVYDGDILHFAPYAVSKVTSPASARQTVPYGTAPRLCPAALGRCAHESLETM
jgi:hypothetical protein